MLKKRLIGVVTVRQGLAVQSFGYRRYLPLGRPEVLAENLDRWGADEILLQCIDRSASGHGPDFHVLQRVATIGLSTPLIYSGGLRDYRDGVEVVRLGADRVVVDALLWAGSPEIERLARELGTQAVIGHMPVGVEGEVLVWRDYRCGDVRKLVSSDCLDATLPWLSEVMLTDWVHEGSPAAFDESIPDLFPRRNIPLILFGGLSEPFQIQRVLQRDNVVAAAMGNFLSYREHAVQHFKRNISGVAMRSAEFPGLGSVT
jgi:cyclase